jgi:hypothetical protein
VELAFASHHRRRVITATTVYRSASLLRQPDAAVLIARR